MADNYLENHREEYERRKAEWLNKKKRRCGTVLRKSPERPEDESL